MRFPLSALFALGLALPAFISAQLHGEPHESELGERAHHGLPKEALQINSIYFGVLPDWSRETAYQINSGLDQHIAIIGDYIYLTDSNDTSPYHQMEWHAESVLSNKNNSVYAPSIIPNFALTEWNDDLTNDLVEEVASFNKRGVTVWLRFCYEMNGAWMDYGLDPETYVEVWRQLSEAIKAHEDATDTWLVWAPNVAGEGVDLDSELGYTPYYPGEEHVDIAGLSYYWSGHNGTNNTIPGEGSFSEGFAPFHDLYGPSHPLIISETSASYHYEMPDHYESNGIDTEVLDIPDLNELVVVPTPSPPEVEMKRAWFEQLTGEQTAAQFPYLTAVTWFNYFKEQAHGQFQDYRIVGSHASLENSFRGLVSESTAYQGSSQPAVETEPENPEDSGTEEHDESMAQGLHTTIVYALCPSMLAGLALLVG